ncbi:MAG: hypothetical protein NXI31_22425 [bacterium]|nr:hypothetical protein [bacterium]
MKRLPMTLVATLLMVAVSAPAQRDVRGERGGRTGIVSSQRHVAGERSGSRHVAKARASRQVAGQRTGGRQHNVRRGGSGRVVSNRVGANRAGANRVGSRVSSRVGVGNRFGRGHVRGGVFVDPICEPVRRVHRHGYWRTVCERVLVEPGRWHRQYVPAVYGWLYDDCGHRYWGIVTPACYERVWCPPRYENRNRRIWVGR